MAFALNRWHSTVASTFLEANAGLQYVFGDVSGALRSRMRYTQRQIDGLGTAKDCGTALIDVLAGFMYDSLGAPATLVTIAVLNASGFLLVRAVYDQDFQADYATTVLFTAVGFGGNGAMLLPGLATTLSNFPEARGMVTGLMKSVFFLCASLYTEWFALLGDNTSAFLVLLALLPALVAVACIPVLITFPSRTSSSAEGMATRRVFFIAGGITLVLAVYMAVIVMLQSEYPASLGVGTAFVPFAFCTMAILMGVYVTLPFLHDALKGSSSLDDTESKPLLRDGSKPADYGASSGRSTSAEEMASAEAADGEFYVGDAANITLLECWRRPDYWMIYTMYTINLAVGLTLSNNLEAVVVSKSAGDVAGYVALSSVATCIGCILGGHLGEAALDPTIGVPRPFCLSPMFLLMALGALGVAFGPGGLLYLNVFLTMFGYGANLCILPATLHERYGNKHFGSIWAFSQTAMVTASVIFATGLAASVYERHASLDAEGVQTCLGNPCFETTFVVLALLAFVGACIAFALGKYIGSFYELVIGLRRGKPGYFAALGFGSGSTGGASAGSALGAGGSGGGASSSSAGGGVAVGGARRSGDPSQAGSAQPTAAGSRAL